MSAPTQRVSLCCDVCGVAFTRYPSQVKPWGPHYCSKACVGKAKRHGSTLHCAWCDAEFYRRFGEQDLGDRVNQFCSRECYMAWRDWNRKPDSYPKDGPVHKHRIVAEALLGRALRPGEVVHHVDGNKQNCHPSNLAVFPDQATHVRCHSGGMSDDELRGFSLLQGGNIAM